MDKERPKIINTLCLVYDHPKILLGMKKRGFGEGRWNGFGGKVDKGESIEGAAKRELYEECGLKAQNMEKFAIIDFDTKDKSRSNPIECHVFYIKSFSGEPYETEEMRPEWFFLDKIPFTEMWPDDAHWFPLFFSGKKFRASFLFDEKDSILEKKIEELENL